MMTQGTFSCNARIVEPERTTPGLLARLSEVSHGGSQPRYTGVQTQQHELHPFLGRGAFIVRRLTSTLHVRVVQRRLAFISRHAK